MNTSWRESKALFLILLLAACVIAVWLHSRAQRHGRSAFPEEVAVSLLNPLQQGIGRLGSAVVDRWHTLRHLGAMEQENRRLRERVAELSRKNQHLQALAAENRRLRKMLGLGPAIPGRRIVAEVVSYSSSNWFHRVRINRGAKDGVTPQCVVLTHEGLVGQVLSTSRHTSLVLLITDADSGVGGLIQRSRAVGVVKGIGKDCCQMFYMDADADVREGDLVVTSHLGEVFPKGIAIGKVVSVEKSYHYSSQSAMVKPSVDLQRLEEVFVLLQGETS